MNPVWETNYAEIISDHYGFTTAEKKLLKDEVIKKGNSLSVNSIPTEEGVEVDSAERVVTAKEFEGWEPISAKAVSGETTYAEAEFTGGKATFGEFEASGYEVKVTYDYDVEIDTDEGKKKIGITRIHIEDDAAKLNHDEFGGGSLVDLNRAGVPLIEIVSEPDMRSSDEARAYMEELRTTLSQEHVLVIFLLSENWKMVIFCGERKSARG